MPCRVFIFAFLLCIAPWLPAEAKPLRLSNLDLKGAPWGSPIESVEIPTDFRFRHSERQDTYAWQGKIKGHEAVVVLAFTHQTRRLYEVSCIVGVDNELPAALKVFNLFKSHLIDLYGKPTHSYNFTYLPFTKGVGYDSLALKEGKYNISDFWSRFKDTFLGMAITPEGWTCITFESKKYSPIATREVNEAP